MAISSAMLYPPPGFGTGGAGEDRGVAERTSGGGATSEDWISYGLSRDGEVPNSSSRSFASLELGAGLLGGLGLPHRRVYELNYHLGRGGGFLLTRWSPIAAFFRIRDWFLFLGQLLFIWRLANSPTLQFIFPEIWGRQLNREYQYFIDFPYLLWGE